MEAETTEERGGRDLGCWESVESDEDDEDLEERSTVMNWWLARKEWFAPETRKDWAFSRKEWVC